ncbi:hypothetical protein EJ06DRAFT_531391 [Trichodelitschia bisporula]|uniref:Uncharacterized protein n=1 Tax=Trichodelitschia bisporula TaxID=703511 RepID=A0A6G1HTM1_9PEZI|nr:hypothetical protein EJ06DRAFT_531391 [Trichodelitschia bisporula]
MIKGFIFRSYGTVLQASSFRYSLLGSLKASSQRVTQQAAVSWLLPSCLCTAQGSLTCCALHRYASGGASTDIRSIAKVQATTLEGGDSSSVKHMSPPRLEI